MSAPVDYPFSSMPSFPASVTPLKRGGGNLGLAGDVATHIEAHIDAPAASIIHTASIIPGSKKRSGDGDAPTTLVGGAHSTPTAGKMMRIPSSNTNNNKNLVVVNTSVDFNLAEDDKLPCMPNQNNNKETVQEEQEEEAVPTTTANNKDDEQKQELEQPTTTSSEKDKEEEHDVDMSDQQPQPQNHHDDVPPTTTTTTTTTTTDNNNKDSEERLPEQEEQQRPTTSSVKDGSELPPPAPLGAVTKKRRSIRRQQQQRNHHKLQLAAEALRTDEDSETMTEDDLPWAARHNRVSQSFKQPKPNGALGAIGNAALAFARSCEAQDELARDMLKSLSELRSSRADLPFAASMHTRATDGFGSEPDADLLARAEADMLGRLQERMARARVVFELLCGDAASAYAAESLCNRQNLGIYPTSAGAVPGNGGVRFLPPPPPPPAPLRDLELNGLDALARAAEVGTLAGGGKSPLKRGRDGKFTRKDGKKQKQVSATAAMDAMLDQFYESVPRGCGNGAGASTSAAIPPPYPQKQATPEEDVAIDKAFDLMEQRLGKGTVKWAAFKVLRFRYDEGGIGDDSVPTSPQAVGMSVKDIVSDIVRRNLRDMSEVRQPEKTISAMCGTDNGFMRVAPGRICLRRLWQPHVSRDCQRRRFPHPSIVQVPAAGDEAFRAPPPPPPPCIVRLL